MADVVNDTFTHLLQPDTILPMQYFTSLRRKANQEPERRLVIAVLEDAVECFQKHLFATNRKSHQLFVDSEAWFESTDRSWPYSFENVCDLLHLDADYLRAGLATWKQVQLSRRSQRGPAKVVPLNAARSQPKRPTIAAPTTDVMDRPLARVAAR